MEYLNFLYELVKTEGIPLIGDVVKSYSRKDSRYNIQNISLYFRTQSTEELRPFFEELICFWMILVKNVYLKTSLAFGAR